MQSSVLFACAFAMAGTVVFAQKPTVTNVTMTQDWSRKVTVSYTLDAPAVVTLDIETNVVGTTDWVSIGGENIGCVVGDANVLVKEAGDHSIYWQADKAWPNHRVTENGARAVVTAWAPDAPPEWMLIDLSSMSNVSYYASQSALPFGHPTNAIYKTSVLLMRKVSAAGRSFRMGVTYGEWKGVSTSYNGFSTFYTKANPHLVSFTNDYYLAVFQFTEGQRHSIFGRWSAYKEDFKVSPFEECPTTGASVKDLRGALDVADWPRHGHAVGSLNACDFGYFRYYTGVDLDLPTEAQWEYACRAGEGRYRSDGGCSWNSDGVGEIAWYSGNSDGKMHPVGLKKPNAWGFYDMNGNGLEWCLDYYVSGYGTGSSIEPAGPDSNSNSYRVARSKEADSDMQYMCSAYRDGYPYNMTSKVVTYRLAAPAVAK